MTALIQDKSMVQVKAVPCDWLEVDKHCIILHIGRTAVQYALEWYRLCGTTY